MSAASRADTTAGPHRASPATGTTIPRSEPRSPDGPAAVDHGPLEERTAELDGFTVNFLHFKQPLDMSLMLRGLPGGRCHGPHWGVVTQGSMSVQYSDHETVETGDVFYMPPGHVPTFEVGTQLIMFSPTEELMATDEAIERNMQVLQAT